MNVLFCDLCNESIPQSDLDTGKAVRRNERLICAACEAAMSGSHARPEARQAPALAAPPAPAVPGSGSSVAAVALAFASVALVVGVGAGAYLFWRLEESDRQTRDEIAQLERLAPESARTVSASLMREIEAREQELAESRAQVARLSTRLDELERHGDGAAALERRVERLDERLGAIDDLNGRVDHQAQVLERLAEETALLAAAVARAPKVPTSTPAEEEPVASKTPQPEAVSDGTPPWQVWVADLSSPDSGTRWQAVQSLGDTHDVEVVPHLVPMLGDGDIFVRMAACRHLGDLGSVEAIPALIDALEDEEASVREAALVALRGLSGQSIPFDPLARDADRSKRVRAWRDWWEDASKQLLGKGKKS